MDTLLWAGGTVAGASLLVWVWLVLARGRFWTTGQRLDSEEAPASAHLLDYSPVAVIVPARNEADTLPATLPALLRQEYPGPFTVFLVDDSSDDGTADAARAVAEGMGAADRLAVVPAGPLPKGWAGKVWAMQRGLEASARTGAPLLMFTDADILHPPASLTLLSRKVLADGLDMVSVMALLRAQSPWERLLIPAYVYFYLKALACNFKRMVHARLVEIAGRYLRSRPQAVSLPARQRCPKVHGRGGRGLHPAAAGCVGPGPGAGAHRIRRSSTIAPWPASSRGVPAPESGWV